MKCEHFVEIQDCNLCSEHLDKVNEELQKSFNDKMKDGMMSRKSYDSWMRSLGNPVENVPIYEEKIEKKKFKWVMPKDRKSDNQR